MTRYTQEGITVEGSDVTVDLTVEGPELEAETVEMHVHDQIVRALQAVESNTDPQECKGYMLVPKWDERLEKIHGDTEQ